MSSTVDCRAFGLKKSCWRYLICIRVCDPQDGQPQRLFVAMAVALLGVGGSSIHFLARPHLLTLLLLSISVWMIEEDRLRPSWKIWLLVPLTIVWTNLHGGFLALIVVLGLAAVGTAIEAWFGNGSGSVRTIRDALRYGELTLACGAASW
jgi:hypothetical protein